MKQLHKILAIIVCIQLIGLNTLQAIKSAKVEVFESSSQARSGVAMGGIGTGSIELRKDGNFYNFSFLNNAPMNAGNFLELATLPHKEVEDSYLFFLVRYQVAGETAEIKLLQSNKSIYEGGLESIIYYYPWMENVAKIEYAARFPFTNMTFSDPDMPFVIELEAFSPFIPHDIKNSSLPGVYFNFKVISKTNKKVDVMLLGSLRNLAGYDTVEKAFHSELVKGDDFTFFEHSVTGMDALSSSNGQMGLGIIGKEDISYYLGWEHKHPYYEKLLVDKRLANINDTESRNLKLADGKTLGRLSTNENDQRCFSSIAISKELNANSSFSTTFFMNWYFPNNYGAVSDKSKLSFEEQKKQAYNRKLKTTKLVGHYYANSFKNIADVATYFSTNASQLRTKSNQFVDDMYRSEIDTYVLDQVNSHLNTFISSTTFTKAGQFGIREGLTPSQAWGPNSTMDVLLYASPMIVGLFPELQKSMMRTHARLQDKSGGVNHGLGFDLDYNQNGTWGVYERVDLVPNYIQMVLRDYLWTNDKAYMTELWPTIKLGIDYILNERDKDGDMMPDMNGIMCSYDNFPMYGLASYIQSQWIAALTMAADVAVDMGDKALAKKYKGIADKGVELMETKLWNGKYFSLSNDYLGKRGVDNGCLTDQIIGQWVMNNVGMKPFLKKEHVRSSLETIMQYSFMNNHFLRNCTWPEHPQLYPIEKSDLWVDQANTAWTGVELAFASLLIQEGMTTDALKVIKAIDDRYRKAGLYFDHQEFGGHYLRPMSAWAIMTAYLGYSVNRNVYSFNPKANTLFFSTPTGTAIFSKKADEVSIQVRTGKLVWKQINIENSDVTTKKSFLFVDNKVLKGAKITSSNGHIVAVVNNEYSINAGSTLQIK